MKGICNSLSWFADEYEPYKTIASIRKYMEMQKRILYSEISGFYFALDAEKQIENKVQNIQKEIYAQLIALVGIFTAMAFLVFGSISVLDNIFNNLQNVSLYKIVIISCIWGLCVLNLISIFIYYVSKMTKLELGVICYRVTAWSDLVLICILLISIWGYYIKRIGIGAWFEAIAKNNAVVVSLGGFAVIILLAVISVVVLFGLGKKKDN